MPKHTPGPWTASPRIYGYGADDDKYWAVQTEDTRIALVATGPSDEGRHDALLIAAAPDMLSALRAAKDELVSMYEQLFADDESDNDTTRVIDRVIATLDKAEGN